MKFIQFMLFLCLYLTCSMVWAGGATKYGKIQTIYVNNGWTMVRVSGLDENPDNCESTYYYALRPEDKNYQTLHSTIVAAQLAGKSVKFWLTGCSGQGDRYPHIVSVWMNS